MKLEKFPFGKYKGKTIDEIPCTYLAYAIENFDLPDDYTNKMRIELFNRLSIEYAFMDIYEVAREITLERFRDDNEVGNGYFGLAMEVRDNPKDTLSLVITDCFNQMNILINPNYDL